MKANSSTTHLKGAIACAIALLALTAGAALAAIPGTTAYNLSSHPMISGTVVTVNDHQMIVDTDQGEQVTLEVDSRTMAPRDLAPGMVMRAEFLALEDCRLYAERIVPIRGGMSTNRQQAYANTRDGYDVIERNASASGEYRREVYGTQASVRTRVTQPQTMGEHSHGPIVTAIPATADHHFSTRAMMTGSVVSVNDHRLVVVTDQGQKVGLAMDSRTMLPGEVAPGSIVRVEFTPMRDGRYYAKRIRQIGSGVVDREQAYAHTRDSEFLVAQNAADCGYVSATAPNTMTSAVVAPAAVVAQSAPPPVVQTPPAPVVETPETLPQTASRQPLILLLGSLALGAAGAVAIRRRLFAA